MSNVRSHTGDKRGQQGEELFRLMMEEKPAYTELEQPLVTTLVTGLRVVTSCDKGLLACGGSWEAELMKDFHLSLPGSSFALVSGETTIHTLVTYQADISMIYQGSLDTLYISLVRVDTPLIRVSCPYQPDTPLHISLI